MHCDTDHGIKRQRREKNVLTWGGNCDQEASCARLLRSELKEHGIEVIVLNDYTVADILLRPSTTKDDCWLPLQLKTTKGPRPQRDDCYVTVWRFCNMKGYSGMPILCVDVSSSRRWLMLGQDWFPRDIDIGALNSKYNELLTRVDDSNKLACEFLSMYNSEHIKRVSEWSARWNITRQTHRVEMESITLWIKYVCIPNGWSYRWPEGQSLYYDLEFTSDFGSTWKRIQMKTVLKSRTASGYSMPLQHQAGYNDEGKPTHKPYTIGDADLYVGLSWNDEHVDIWTFDETDLVERLSTSSSVGKTSIRIHLPAELTNERTNDANDVNGAKRRPGPICKTLWTRRNHKRYLRARATESDFNPCGV